MQKSLTKHYQIESSSTLWKLYTISTWALLKRCKYVKRLKIDQCNPPYWQDKEENAMEISIDEEKSCDIIKHLFMTKLLEKYWNRWELGQFDEKYLQNTNS